MGSNRIELVLKKGAGKGGTIEFVRSQPAADARRSEAKKGRLSLPLSSSVVCAPFSPELVCEIVCLCMKKGGGGASYAAARLSMFFRPSIVRRCDPELDGSRRPPTKKVDSFFAKKRALALAVIKTMRFDY